MSIKQCLVTGSVVLSIVGCNGEDATCWREMNIPIYTENIYTLWGNSPNDVFAIGEDEDSGIVLHFDGSAWEEVPLSVDDYEYFRGVWGIPGRHFFIKYQEFSSQGDESTIVEYDGQDQIEINTVVPGRYSDIWGSSQNDIFAVGYSEVPGRYQSEIMHFDGEKWNEMENTFTIALRSVWGNSGTDVFAVGADGILHYDGTSWSSMEENLPYFLNSVWGASENSVYAGGGTVLHYDGIRWKEVSDIVSWDIWVSPDSEVFISGGDEPARSSDGKNWMNICTIGHDLKSQREQYFGIWGASTNEVFIGGSKGRPQAGSIGMILKSDFKEDLNCFCER